jgi:NlpC/P60 family
MRVQADFLGSVNAEIAKARERNLTMKKIVLLFIVFSLGACAPTVLTLPDSQPVSEEEAAKALAEAQKHLEAPYELGARGPKVFDSSSIILYSYRQVIPSMRLRISERDANFDTPHSLIYYWNFQPLALEQLKPGDLVYISDGTNPVTHGALFVEWVEPYKVMKFLHASTRLGKVVIEEWPVDKEVRGQTFVAGGRLKVIR